MVPALTLPLPISDWTAILSSQVTAGDISHFT